MSTVKVNLQGINELDFPIGVNSATTANGVTTINMYQPLVIGFVINSGVSGTNIGPILIAPYSSTVSKCKLVVKTSDASTNLIIKIRQNGTDVFSADPSITAGTTPGTLFTFTSLTSTPLTVNADDLFTIDIVTGAADWTFTVQLE